VPDDKLKEYLRKRDFDRTPEPSGGDSDGDEPRFVIQKHDATQVHYDFRIEWNGVLLSWAVPKGPSTDPREKRLAVRTEDHPLDYVDFEGVIPEREYGGGTVIVWDTGAYTNLSSEDGRLIDVGAGLDKGHVRVWLHGEKLQGAWDLIHARLGGEEKNWLLRKVDDAAADARRNPTSTQPESVLTGRTIEEVAAEGQAADPS
jgi:DNA ligase D-like protein (predicted 3'-phosphoesterase)